MRNWWYINLSQNIPFRPNKGKRATKLIFSVESFMQILFSLVSKAKRVKLLHRRKVRTTTRLQDLTLGARKGVIPGY